MYVASGTSETMLEQWWFAVHVAVCGAGVIPPKLKSRLPSKSCSVKYVISHRSDSYRKNERRDI